MTRYIGLSLFAWSLILAVACQSSPPSHQREDRTGHAMQAERASTMAKTEQQSAGQTPNLPQIDQRALEQFTRQEPQFKQHYETHYADSGYAYNQYRPAYQYGYELATDQRYRKMDWSTLELQARRGWNDGTMGLWDRYKDAVRFGWERGVIDERG